MPLYTLKKILFSHKFVTLCDHKALIFLISCYLIGGRLTRWKLLLQEFDYEITFIKGEDNWLADYLSRLNMSISSSEYNIILISHQFKVAGHFQNTYWKEKFGTIEKHLTIATCGQHYKKDWNRYLTWEDFVQQTRCGWKMENLRSRGNDRWINSTTAFSIWPLRPHKIFKALFEIFCFNNNEIG